jgi:hypothetical protein
MWLVCTFIIMMLVSTVGVFNNHADISGIQTILLSVAVVVGALTYIV